MSYGTIKLNNGVTIDEQSLHRAFEAEDTEIAEREWELGDHDIDAYANNFRAAYEQKHGITFEESLEADWADEAADMLAEQPWETIEHYMDEDLAFDISQAIAPCSNERFLRAYFLGHALKFAETFSID
jgi:hypothetical protein